MKPRSRNLATWVRIGHQPKIPIPHPCKSSAPYFAKVNSPDPAPRRHHVQSGLQSAPERRVPGPATAHTNRHCGGRARSPAEGIQEYKTRTVAPRLSQANTARRPMEGRSNRLSPSSDGIQGGPRYMEGPAVGRAVLSLSSRERSAGRDQKARSSRKPLDSPNAHRGLSGTAQQEVYE